MGALAAERYVARVALIPVADLVSAGVRCVLLDRDNTCVPLGSSQAPQEVLDWIAEVHAAGISTCVVSNNIHVREVTRSACLLGSQAVACAFKPAPFSVWVALRKMGVSRGEAVLVGDQVFTDVLAARLADVRAILVRPQTRRDLWYARPLRLLERRVLGAHRFEGER
ncbi:YqeG family HAD IIIA-type phosphatase [Olsenella uli]|uniref:YqeG family HAD IIIA-type phosphatase n=1 Tax=Olsenella uli TaxID=133926 RepID=UPI00241CA737|nr:HAD hydrolase-like protein [Olsenella uli]